MEPTRFLHERKGEICTINEKDSFDTFCADLINFTVTPKTVKAEYSEQVGSSGYHLSNYIRGDANLEIEFYVEGTTQESMFVNVSNLIAECKKCTINISPDDFLYNTILISSTVEKLEIEHFARVVLKFVTTIVYPLQSVMLENGTGSIRNVGTLESGLKLTIISASALAELKINDITVKNITANMPFIIDGIEGKVMSNNINRFLDTDLISFPKIKQGLNQITCDKTVKIIAEFYPTFII